MRTPGEIKRKLLVLRDIKHLPYPHMMENSRCSREQIISALKLEATEDVLQRLDAYLDAPHLHTNTKYSEILWRYENNDRELYRLYGAKSLHRLTVQDMSAHQIKRMVDAMDYRLKKLLKRYCEIKGVNQRLPDGLSYWDWKKRIFRRFPEIKVGIENGDARRILREGPVGESRFL